MKIANLLILTLAAGIAARADFSYTSARKPAEGQAAANAGDQSMRHYLKGQKLKIDRGKSATVFDFDAQTVTALDNNAKTYTVSNFSDLGQDVKTGDMNIKIDVQKTGQSKNINGFNANEVLMSLEMENPDGRAAGMKVQVEMHMWLSPDVPGAQQLRAFYEKNRDHLPWAALGSGGHPAMQKAMAEIQRKTSELNGVPVLQVIKVKPAGNSEQTAKMQQQMAQARARLEEMQKQGGPQAAAAAQALARMGGMSSGSGALFEIAMEATNFSTDSIPDSVFAVPPDFQKAAKK